MCGISMRRQPLPLVGLPVHACTNDIISNVGIVLRTCVCVCVRAAVTHLPPRSSAFGNVFIIHVPQTPVHCVLASNFAQNQRQRKLHGPKSAYNNRKTPTPTHARESVKSAAYYAVLALSFIRARALLRQARSYVSRFIYENVIRG